MEVIQSRYSNDKILYNWYLYRRDRVNKTTVNWRCVQDKCKGRISTPLDYRNGAIPNVKNDHNHPANPADVQKQKGIAEMKERAAATDAPPRRLIGEMMGNLTDETLTNLPQRSALRRTIQRKRKRDDAFPPLPLNLEDIEIPEQFREVLVGGTQVRFLLHDTGDADNDAEEEENRLKRIILFGTDEMLRFMTANSNWMADGTFKVAPQLFFQLYTIHVIKDNHVFPCLYALLAGKNRRTYEEMWRLIKMYAPNLNPRICILDFELTAKSAIISAFPHIEVRGCFFHLCQSIWRKIQDLGLRVTYTDDEDTRLYCRMLGSLAFLSPEKITGHFEKLQEDMSERDMDPRLGELYDYFEDNYVGRLRRGRRRDANPTRAHPRFALEFWSVRDRNQVDLPRTNNKLEGWHRGLQFMFDGPNPSIWKFIAGIQKEQSLQHGVKIQMEGGHPGPTSKKHFSAINKRLQTLIQSYERAEDNEDEEVPFLRSVARNIEFNVC